MSGFTSIPILGLCALLVVSCGKAPATSADTSEPETSATISTIWPSSLNVLGDGFPKPGDPCRRIGESAATANYLDDSAILVGCPGSVSDDPAEAIVAVGGHAVGTEQNITLLSIPQGDANVGMNPGGGESAPPSAQSTKGKATQ